MHGTGSTPVEQPILASRRAGIDQAIAGLVRHERIPRSGLSHELDLDRDSLADLALAR